jgi:mannose-6-phosphate isomerase-like protein (cupin superfamily)
MTLELTGGKEVLTVINAPALVQAAGNKPKSIEEFFGIASSRTRDLSIARMKSPGGWIEPGQTPQFDEYSIVLKGILRISTRENSIDLHAGQAALSHRGEWVQYSTPDHEGAEYISVCLPAFSPLLVHRDPETQLI